MVAEFTHSISNFDSMVSQEEFDRDEMSKLQIVRSDELLQMRNRTKEEPSVYVIEFETEPDEKEEMHKKRGKDGTVGKLIFSIFILRQIDP